MKITLLLATIAVTFVATDFANAQKAFTNAVGIEFLYVQPGQFQMGSNYSPDEQPIHTVTFNDGYFLGRFEVTQKQWKQVMKLTIRQQRDKEDRSWRILGEGPTYPAYYISWHDAVDFIARLNNLNDGYYYSLPTEAAWEYAARAGSTSGRYGALDRVAWYAGNSGDVLHPVGQKTPNDWGFYDMLGNVFEWVQDAATQDFRGSPSNGLDFVEGGPNSQRVPRGGAYNQSEDNIRLSYRGNLQPTHRSLMDGFRVMAVKRESASKLAADVSSDSSRLTANRYDEKRCMHRLITNDIQSNRVLRKIPISISSLENGNLVLHVSASGGSGYRSPISDYAFRAMSNGETPQQVLRRDRSVAVLVNFERQVRRMSRIKRVSWTSDRPCLPGFVCQTTGGGFDFNAGEGAACKAYRK